MKIEVDDQVVDNLVKEWLLWLLEHDPHVVAQEDLDAWEELRGAARTLLRVNWHYEKGT